MIRYRPHRHTLTASLKDELIFATMAELFDYLFDSWGRVISYMGAEPFRPEEITINGLGSCNPLTGYKREHKVMVRRIADAVFDPPLCIGYCDLG